MPPAFNVVRRVVRRLATPQAKARHRGQPLSHPAAPPIIRIQRSQGWGDLQLQEIWEYRDLIFFLILCDLKGRYRQMVLGPLWVIIQPLLTVVTSTVIFSLIARLPSDGLPYPLFNYVGVLPWSLFGNSVNRAAGSLVGYQHLISKVYFPRLVVPLVCVLSGLPDFGISAILLLGLMAIYGVSLSLKILVIPGLLLLELATALAIGLWSASLLARFRDVGVLLGYGMQAWMYATPIIYPTSMVPAEWQFLYHLNPMTNVVGGFRWALLGTDPPLLVPMAISVLLVAIALISGAYCFRQTERTIVDIL